MISFSRDGILETRVCLCRLPIGRAFLYVYRHCTNLWICANENITLASFCAFILSTYAEVGTIEME